MELLHLPLARVLGSGLLHQLHPVAMQRCTYQALGDWGHSAKENSDRQRVSKRSPGYIRAEGKGGEGPHNVVARCLAVQTVAGREDSRQKQIRDG